MKSLADIEKDGYNEGYSSANPLRTSLANNPYKPDTAEYFAYDSGVRRGFLDWFCE